MDEGTYLYFIGLLFFLGFVVFIGRLDKNDVPYRRVSLHS